MTDDFTKISIESLQTLRQALITYEVKLDSEGVRNRERLDRVDSLLSAIWGEMTQREMKEN